MLEAHARLRETIEHWGLIRASPIGTNAFIAEIVCHNQYDIRLVWRTRCSGIRGTRR